jgi:hypothetical protein
MTEQVKELRCPRCGESSAGRFCAGCGAPLRDVTCDACGHPAAPGARFCGECGAPLGAAPVTAGTPAAAQRPERLVPLIGGGALLVLVAFVAGQALARRSASSATPDDQVQTTPLAGSVAAPDISAMSPEERASRLFNRVMLYSEQGKKDSAAFFAPMAIQAYQMIGPADAHMRYDIGAISAAVGDAVRASAEADTILKAQPKHLLGLVLAIRVAELSNDKSAATALGKRLVAAAPAERATGLKEYTEHARDIDDALKKYGSASR